jgi:hypothetical protein
VKFSGSLPSSTGSPTINHFIRSVPAKRHLLGMCQHLDRCFSPAGVLLVWPVSRYSTFSGRRPRKYFAPRPCCADAGVWSDRCYSRVQGIVRTKYDIDLPVHWYRRVLLAACRTGVSRFMADLSGWSEKRAEYPFIRQAQPATMDKAFLTSLSTHEKSAAPYRVSRCGVPCYLTSWNPRLSYAA